MEGEYLFCNGMKASYYSPSSNRHYSLNRAVIEEVSRILKKDKFQVQYLILGYRDINSSSLSPECKTKDDYIKYCQGLDRALAGLYIPLPLYRADHDILARGITVKSPYEIRRELEKASSVSNEITPILINVPKI